MLIETDRITEVYNRHVDTVYRLCYSYMKNISDTEDMVQETFLRLIRSGKSFESLRHEKAWLIVTASNLCKDHLKHWWRRNVSLEDSPTVEPAADHTDILTAILDLPAEYKTVIYMYYYEGYTSKEIAEFLRCTESTVRSRLTRARSKLKISLGGSGYDKT